MSDETPNTPADAPAPEQPKSTGYTDADVAAILAADREQRAAEAPDDPVARFRKSTSGTALYSKKPTPAAPPQPEGSRLTSAIESLIALQVAAMKPPAPPAPPKVMTPAEKLATNDPEIWLRRGNPNQWGSADKDALVAEHASALRKQGFAGDVDREANTRASRDIVSAAQKALRHVRIVPDNMADLADLAARFRK